MGTPEFSIPTLRLLKNLKYNIVCVYTQPARKKSRGQKILKTPIPQDDPLKWVDSKPYKERLKAARKKTGQESTNYLA